MREKDFPALCHYCTSVWLTNQIQTISRNATILRNTDTAGSNTEKYYLRQLRTFWSAVDLKRLQQSPTDYRLIEEWGLPFWLNWVPKGCKWPFLGRGLPTLALNWCFCMSTVPVNKSSAFKIHQLQVDLENLNHSQWMSASECSRDKT